jgi:hypothetical protein
LREAVKFPARLISELGLEELEQMAGGRDRLAKGSEVGFLWRSGGDGELGNRVKGSSILTSAVKFSLQVELRHFHIAQGHADVFVPEQLHEHGETNAEPYHFSCEAVPEAVGSDFACATNAAGAFGQDMAEAMVDGGPSPLARQ